MPGASQKGWACVVELLASGNWGDLSSANVSEFLFPHRWAESLALRVRKEGLLCREASSVGSVHLLLWSESSCTWAVR